MYYVVFINGTMAFFSVARVNENALHYSIEMTHRETIVHESRDNNESDVLTAQDIIE